MFLARNADTHRTSLARPSEEDDDDEEEEEEEEEEDKGSATNQTNKATSKKERWK